MAVNLNIIREGAVGLQISIRECNDVTILDLWGRSTIDDGESELLSKHLRALAAKGKRKLLLNLSNLTMVDSSGVSVIVEMYVFLDRLCGELKLLGPCDRVLEVLNVFRLLDVIPSFDDEPQALASFSSTALPSLAEEKSMQRATVSAVNVAIPGIRGPRSTS